MMSAGVSLQRGTTMPDEATRPPFICHGSDIEEPTGAGDLQALLAPFGRRLGLLRIGVNQEVVPPGCRTSEPHAHSHEEEFVYVLDGHPHVWIDGVLHGLRPGDGLAFAAGTGIAHCLINDSGAPVRLLIVGDNHPDDRIAYPVNPEFRDRPDYWNDAPVRPLGPHDGRPAH
jgi:uncharacterized cupin superfamily protein